MSKGYFGSISVSTWKLSTFISNMLVTKIALNMWMWEPFYNKSGVTVS